MNQIWYQGDTYNLAIGQGYILATPLQITTSFQLIANKGTIYKPYLVKAILNKNNKEIKKIFWQKEEIQRKAIQKNNSFQKDEKDDDIQIIKIQPQILKENFVSQKSIELIREGMRLAVASMTGSAVRLKSLSVPLAAKTGTAQIYSPQKIYNQWLTVFGPYEDPTILLTIVLENVKGTPPLALEAAKEILEWYFFINKF